MEEYSVLRLILYLAGIIGVVVAFHAAYLVWAERKIAAHVQRRIGPKEVGPFGLLQPLADGAKLMSKQLFRPAGADAVLFWIAPFMVLVPAVMSMVTIPFSENLVARDINIGILMIFAFASVNVLGLLLGGWGSANKYAVISAARAVSQNVAYEIPMLIIVITVAMATNTLNLNDIVRQQDGWIWNWNAFNWLKVGPFMFANMIMFFICSLAETNRAPFDMAEAESELIAGAYTEYPGMGFGVFFMGEYANIVIGCALTTILFLGGWQSPVAFLPDGVWWFVIKLYALLYTVIWVRWVYPRTTLYGLLNLSWKVLIPFTLFNLIMTGLWLKVFKGF